MVTLGSKAYFGRENVIQPLVLGSVSVILLDKAAILTNQPPQLQVKNFFYIGNKIVFLSILFGRDIVIQPLVFSVSVFLVDKGAILTNQPPRLQVKKFFYIGNKIVFFPKYIILEEKM